VAATDLLERMRRGRPACCECDKLREAFFVPPTCPRCLIDEAITEIERLRAGSRLVAVEPPTVASGFVGGFDEMPIGSWGF
jgi:hypothetical protein